MLPPLEAMSRKLECSHGFCAGFFTLNGVSKLFTLYALHPRCYGLNLTQAAEDVNSLTF
jgi:hypothetical protein